MSDDEYAWETAASTIDYTCSGFHVRRDDVRLPDGTESSYHYVSQPDSVVVLPLTPEGEVVVIDEWRQPVGRLNRALPAGGLETDDTDLLAAAARELTEETGYEGETFERYATHEPANAMFDACFHYVVARDCRPTGSQNLDANEFIRVDTADFDALYEACLDGEMRDGRTALGVLQYAGQREA